MSSLAQFLFNLGQVIEQYGNRIEQCGGEIGDKRIAFKDIKLQRFANAVKSKRGQAAVSNY